jgi:hypothetical protein
LYVHMIWISTKPYVIHMEGINAYVNKNAYKYIYIYIYLFDSLIIFKFWTLLCGLEKSGVLRGLLLWF